MAAVGAVALDSKWRKLKNFSKIYAEILEEERARDAAAAAAAAEGKKRKPSLILRSDGCLATEDGGAILEKESGCVTLTQKKNKRPMPPHRSNSLENWDGEYLFKGFIPHISINSLLGNQEEIKTDF